MNKTKAKLQHHLVIVDSHDNPIQELPQDAAKALGAALAEFIWMREKTAAQKLAAENY